MLNTTKYYDEFLRYFEMAKWQHENCNLGTIPYDQTPYDDDLIKNVFLYDVVARKYAGFSQILLDMWYNTDNHPYSHKLTQARLNIVQSFDTDLWSLEEWLYVFFIHRLTGSGINYALSPSGYHNSILLKFDQCDNIDDMIVAYKIYEGPKFTSYGYQIAPFPKPKDGYAKGGDWFICEVLPDLVKRFCDWFLFGGNHKKTFREMMDWLKAYNQEKGFRVFYFQYAAVLADIADFFPQCVITESHFFYGKNAMECLNYMAERPRSQKPLDFYDALTDKILKDTDAVPYNSEDVACDCIRWIENYINTKQDYSHLDLDSVWSSHQIEDHPFGRQKPMLELGLVDSFNGKGHPSDDKIIKEAGLTVQEYKNAVYAERI
jgi:hypothetical protein